jgi:hypothetical protein
MYVNKNFSFKSIETDLREMLGETDLPAPVEAVGGVLM